VYVCTLARSRLPFQIASQAAIDMSRSSESHVDDQLTQPTSQALSLKQDLEAFLAQYDEQDAAAHRSRPLEERQQEDKQLVAAMAAAQAFLANATHPEDIQLLAPLIAEVAKRRRDLHLTPTGHHLLLSELTTMSKHHSLDSEAAATIYIHPAAPPAIPPFLHHIPIRSVAVIISKIKELERTNSPLVDWIAVTVAAPEDLRKYAYRAFTHWRDALHAGELSTQPDTIKLASLMELWLAMPVGVPMPLLFPTMEAAASVFAHDEQVRTLAIFLAYVVELGYGTEDPSQRTEMAKYRHALASLIAATHQHKLYRSGRYTVRQLDVGATSTTTQQPLATTQTLTPRPPPQPHQPPPHRPGLGFQPTSAPSRPGFHHAGTINNYHAVPPPLTTSLVDLTTSATATEVAATFDADKRGKHTSHRDEGL
jgi:hypothetical protein